MASLKISFPEKLRKYDLDDSKLDIVEQFCSNKVWDWEQCQLEEEGF